MSAALKRSPAEVARALRKWLTSLPADWPPADTATTAFCRQRLERLADEAVLTAKVAADLGSRPWRPLGHVLAVVSENDHLGVVAALMAAALTGNRLTLKSRAGLAALRSLRDALGWDEAACRIADWSSEGQNDAELLAGVDGVVLAGSEALIRHYRRAAAQRVRLIEYGPQMSAACIAEWPVSTTEQAACIDALIRDTTLFLQNVCSSPQFVLTPGAAAAEALFAALAARLAVMPPLPEEIRLQQSIKAQELRLLARLGEPVDVALDAGTGWAVTRSPSDVAYWMPRGFRLIVGGLEKLQEPSLPLQTLGIWPSPAVGPVEAAALHRCRLGRMHERPVTAPHDGHWELAQWVSFVSCDTQ
ncbi:acyl-CoA reductase [Thauera sinica]|uniref:Acyl-CoA reductase n=1 Tax=Thauera sinica TaxID=2665146 RepID=A0ABW1AQE4_9RHOO|nr:acyl-CoA reductase [Thauera sp. K11]